MDFENNFFDLIYSFHALEHIPDYNKALSEIHRVLKPGCFFFVGTPNKSRIVGYLGVNSNYYNTKKKIVSNLLDYKHRLLGKFENKYGAHAGFTIKELRYILEQYFMVSEVSTDYYYGLYSKHRLMIRFLEKTNLTQLIFPSVYCLCKKMEDIL